MIDKAQQRIAWHKAGHAFIALKHGLRIKYASIIADDELLGFGS